MKIGFTLIITLGLYGCDGESTVTEHFKRVETKELILTDQQGKTYQLKVDSEGNVKALEIKLN